MKRLRIQLTIIAIALTASLAALPAAAQCDDGREGVLSDVFIGSSALEWRMLVEHKAVTLTVSAPCGLVVERTYKEGESPVFALKDIPAVDPDGAYHWQLRIAPHVDKALEQELAAAHEDGDGRLLEYELRQKGKLPAGPFLESGTFTVFRGAIVPPDEEERSSGKLSAGVRPAAAAGAECPHAVAPALQTSRLSTIVPAVDRGGSTRDVAAAAETPRRITAEDFVINDDLIVFGSACIGFDCANGETFSFDTIKLKENNLRISFIDTSTSSGFPAGDWQIRANDSFSGGGNFLSIDWLGTNANLGNSPLTTPFRVDGSAPTNALRVVNNGRVGFRTASPVLDLHVATPNTPGIRLEQTSAGGFAAQTWDIAGNEANFFVRDATSGSQLPFRIRPGAPSNSLHIVANGDVGIGTASPAASVDIVRSGSAATQQTTSFSATAADAPQFILRRARGTSPAPAALSIADNLGLISFRGYQGTGFSGSRALVTAQATESWSGAANGTKLLFSTTANGSTSPTVRFEIRENGDIFAGGAVVHSSSRALKENFADADPEAVLSRVAELPIGYWNYKKDDASLRHLGPTAEDFAVAFGLGTDDKTIAVNDSVGVALAAIQGLYRQASEREAQMTRRLADRDARIADLEAKLEALEAALPR